MSASISAAALITAAVALAIRWANDPAHGYDQSSRWGPDFDCSSFIISVWEAVGVPVREAGASYTGNMLAAFVRCGFAALSPGVPLRSGDVLLWHNSKTGNGHAAMYAGDGKIVQARINELGKISGGKTGDQAEEITVSPYYSAPWDAVLRFEGAGGTDAPADPETPVEDATAPAVPGYRPGDRYMVQPEDTLWGIAERYLGDGNLWPEIYRANGLTSTTIHAGQVLVLPEGDAQPAPDPEPATGVPDIDVGDNGAELPVLSSGDAGQAVEALQLLLLRAGYPLPRYGVDGDFGEETEAALRAYQQAEGLTVTGTTTPITWVKLIEG